MVFDRFKQAAFFFRQELWPLTLIFLVASLPLSWLPKLSDAPLAQTPLFLLLCETVLGGIAGAAGLLFIHRKVGGNDCTISACYRQALARFGPVIILALLSNTLIVVGLGFMVVPGLILMFAFLFAQIELVINGKTPVQSLLISWRTTMIHAQTLLPAFIALLCALLSMELIKQFLGAHTGASTQAASSVLLVIEPLGYAWLSAYFSVLIYRIYQCIQNA